MAEWNAYYFDFWQDDVLNVLTWVKKLVFILLKAFPRSAVRAEFTHGRIKGAVGLRLFTIEKDLYFYELSHKATYNTLENKKY